MSATAPISVRSGGSRGGRSWFQALAVPVLAAWTLFVWGGRLRNLAADPGGLAEANRWSLVSSVVFCLLAVAVIGGLVVKRARVVTAVLAAVTTVVWLIRGVDIALGDHSLGFIAVHVVLAVVSIGLSAAAVLLNRAGSASFANH